MLAVRRELVRNEVPTVPGGGTVAYVNPVEHVYLSDPVAREEGGTPDIVGSIRAGLVFQLKQAVGTDLIRARETALVRRAIERWGANPAIRILAVEGLAKAAKELKDPDTIQTLREKASDDKENGYVRNQAALALRDLQL
mgnify:CR=1 FL=1